jgi:DNA integrity scanning protein DisA with diadenylate cyclase activity
MEALLKLKETPASLQELEKIDGAAALRDRSKRQISQALYDLVALSGTLAAKGTSKRHALPREQEKKKKNQVHNPPGVRVL